MHAASATWLLRAALFALAFAGPLAAYWIILAVTNDGQTAVDGLGWGFLVSLAATVAFAFTVNARWPARMGWGFVFLTLAAILWTALLTLG